MPASSVARDRTIEPVEDTIKQHITSASVHADSAMATHAPSPASSPAAVTPSAGTSRAANRAATRSSDGASRTRSA